MQKRRIYCDTNIYIDFLCDRESSFGERLGDSAYNVFSQVYSCKFYLVISDLVKKELSKHVNNETTAAFFSLLKNKIIEVETTDDDKLKAQRINKIEDINDTLHVILALKAGCEAVITNNLKDFIHYRNLIKIIAPRNILSL